jgi:Fe-S cluster assembly iron-binding protein IscA
MLTVTEIAKEKLEEQLSAKTTDPEMTIRLVSAPSGQRRFTLVLDKEKKGDQVVESKAGTKVLIIGSYLASELEGLVVDYQETPKGEGFTISMPAPGA